MGTLIWVGVVAWVIGAVVCGLMWTISLCTTIRDYRAEYRRTNARDLQDHVNSFWQPIAWPVYFGVIGWRAWRRFRVEVAAVDAKLGGVREVER